MLTEMAYARCGDMKVLRSVTCKSSLHKVPCDGLSHDATHLALASALHIVHGIIVVQAVKCVDDAAVGIDGWLLAADPVQSRGEDGGNILIVRALSNQVTYLCDNWLINLLALLLSALLSLKGASWCSNGVASPSELEHEASAAVTTVIVVK